MKIKRDDDVLLVTGVIARTDRDVDGQMLEGDWLDRELLLWLKRGGNVTINFQGDPVARCIEMFADGEARYGTVQIFTDEAKRLIQADALKGLSISIANAQVQTSDEAPNGKVTGF